MNPKIIKLTFILLAFSLVVAFGVHVSFKNPVEKPHVSKSLCISKLGTYPGFCVYKTNGDYFNNVSCTYRNGQIDRVPAFTLGGAEQYFSSDTLYKCRVKLCKGYILDTNCSYHDVFLNIDHQSYFQWENESCKNEITKDTLASMILDHDPFTEFWYVRNTGKGSFTVEEVEKLIREGKLKDYFKKIK